jgi:hypothetical protein
MTITLVFAAGSSSVLLGTVLLLVSEGAALLQYMSMCGGVPTTVNDISDTDSATFFYWQGCAVCVRKSGMCIS